MTDDVTRKGEHKETTRPVSRTSRTYDSLLTFLGARLYEERNRERRAQKADRDERGEDDADQ